MFSDPEVVLCLMFLRKQMIQSGRQGHKVSSGVEEEFNCGEPIGYLAFILNEIGS